jgi:predicted DNA binding CopG/RHH family protein
MKLKTEQGVKNAKLNLRLSSEDFELMKKAISKFNENKIGLELNRNSFFRMAIRLLSEKILYKNLTFGVSGKD